MATYALTVSTDALGLGVIGGAIVVVERKRTLVTDIYPTSSLCTKKIATNVSGIAIIQLEADDGTVFHEVKIFDALGVMVYKNVIQMPPQAADIKDLPLNNIILAGDINKSVRHDLAQNLDSEQQERARLNISALQIINASTFADIPEITSQALVNVIADETNAGLSTIYFYNGATLNWIPSVEV